jgi:hypothetical protein
VSTLISAGAALVAGMFLAATLFALAGATVMAL